MSNDQFYRLVESWPGSEWPLPLDDEILEQLNEVAPPGYHYAKEPSLDGHPRVELYEYVGEFNPLELADDDHREPEK